MRIITAFWVLLYLQAAMAQPAGQTRSSLGSETGFFLFQTRCMTCHGNPKGGDKAQDPAVIRQMSPERIYESLTTGTMKAQGEKLTDDQKKILALYMSGRPMGSAGAGDAKSMPNRCSANPALTDPASGATWNGWGVDVTNTRFQGMKAAGLTADQVPQLKLKWAFGFPTGLSSFGQPTVASGRVFVGSDIGYVYSLDASSGCVYWSFEAKGAVRHAISIGPVKGRGGARYAVYFGDVHANAYAVNAQNGELLWMTPVEKHFSARITAAPALHDGRLYVPVSSSEGYSAGIPDYACCTFRGSVAALDANTGKQIWKTYTISEPKPTKKNSKGTQLYAPAGVSVWNTPTIDVQRQAVYFGTGDSWTEPAADTSDAIMALDMKTGRVLWTFQATKDDVWVGGCSGPTKSEACPKVQGPDADFGSSPILRTLPNGRRILVAGQKSGSVFGLDPDRNGALVWESKAGSDAARGGIFFGGAADEQDAYFALSGGGIAAIDLATGERKWSVPLAKPGARVSFLAAVSAIPGVAFVGGSDGILNAVSTLNGSRLWSVETAHEFTTVNHVPANGGSMGAPGPTIAGGMLFVGSGYGVTAGTKPGNVLLAFGIQ